MDFLAIDKIQNPHVMAEQTLLDNISLYVFFLSGFNKKKLVQNSFYCVV